MKWMYVVLTAWFALVAVSTPAQIASPRVQELFQVKKNVLFVDRAGTKLDDIAAEDVRFSEDGARQKITSLTANPSPLFLEIVLDDSGSMESQMKQMVAIAKFIVQNLEDESLIQVIRFGNAERVKVANEWTVDKQFVLQNLEEKPVQGMSSPVFDGVWTALDQIKFAKDSYGSKRFAIVLVSDCMENGSSRNQNELLDELNKANVPVFVVAITELFDSKDFPVPQAEKSMYLNMIERLAYSSALASGGSVYFPSKGDNARLPLAETLKSLAAELRSSYVLTYTPTNQNRDGKERNLRIELADSLEGNKCVATIKQTYVVPTPK